LIFPPGARPRKKPPANPTTNAHISRPETTKVRPQIQSPDVTAKGGKKQKNNKHCDNHGNCDDDDDDYHGGGSSHERQQRPVVVRYASPAALAQASLARRTNRLPFARLAPHAHHHTQSHADRQTQRERGAPSLCLTLGRPFPLAPLPQSSLSLHRRRPRRPRSTAAVVVVGRRPPQPPVTSAAAPLLSTSARPPAPLRLAAAALWPRLDRARPARAAVLAVVALSDGRQRLRQARDTQRPRRPPP
jgi:hypothetical protein